MSDDATDPREPAELALSAVVITYNRRPRLEAHLPALLADPAATEVVVVNDGSTDDTEAYLRELAEQHPKLVPLTIPNSGMDAARRAGVERATGDVVLLLDDDVEPDPGLAAKHLDEHRGRDGLVVVGYMPTEEPTTATPGSFATTLYARSYETVVRSYEEDPSTVLFSLWNGNVSLRREDYLRARRGMSWPRNGYHEDLNLGLQCHRLGLVGEFHRELSAVHRHVLTPAGFRRNARGMGYARAALHELHGDLLGPYERWRDAELGSLPTLVRCLLRLIDRLGIGELASAVLFALTNLAGRLRLWSVEVSAARFMRQVEMRLGAEQWYREREHGEQLEPPAVTTASAS